MANAEGVVLEGNFGKLNCLVLPDRGNPTTAPIPIAPRSLRRVIFVLRDATLVPPNLTVYRIIREKIEHEIRRRL